MYSVYCSSLCSFWCTQHKKRGPESSDDTAVYLNTFYFIFTWIFFYVFRNKTFISTHLNLYYVHTKYQQYKTQHNIFFFYLWLLNIYSRCIVMYLFDFVFVTLVSTWAVGPSAVNVIIGLPLLSDLVRVDEYDQYCDKTYERHQHCCAQSCIDIWDEAPKSGDRDRELCKKMSPKKKKIELVF